MQHAMDDFTIVLPELADIGSGDLKVYDGLDQLWRMVERYKMTAPITITVVDKTARHVRAIRGHRIPAGRLAIGGCNECGNAAPCRRIRIPADFKSTGCQGEYFENESTT
jgi:hypothetical protein